MLSRRTERADARHSAGAARTCAGSRCGWPPRADDRLGQGHARADRRRPPRPHRHPAQTFDITRRVRVFNSAFQFVELEMAGTNLACRTGQIPNHLLEVAERKTLEQLRTVFQVAPPRHELCGDTFERLRRRAERDYLRMIPRYGEVVKRSDEEALLKGIALLREHVEVFKATVRDRLGKELERRVVQLEKALLSRLREVPLREWLLPSDPDGREAGIRRCLRRNLERAVGPVDSHFGEMNVCVKFKDVMYESLTDDAFLAAARKAFPKMPQLHAEIDAAAPTDRAGVA